MKLVSKCLPEELVADGSVGSFYRTVRVRPGPAEKYMNPAGKLPSALNSSTIWGKLPTYSAAGKPMA
jgi:hypothetical protein